MDPIIDLNAIFEMGFHKEGDSYIYKEDIGDGFILIVKMDKDCHFSSTVLDEFGEPYAPYLSKRPHGDFVGRMKEEAEAIIGMAESYISYPEKEDPHKGAIELIDKLLGIKPEYPFSEEDSYTPVWRVKPNGKWFAVGLNVSYKKLEYEENGDVAVLLVKQDPGKIKSLVYHDGYAPAYHMNKTHWLSLLLDGRLSEQQLSEAILESHKLVKGK
ncbi:MAG: MmcQ/YjbR family DNA-binding protein [Bacillota bacterium]|nr:MmcQ/YjbR family DNA-binding protein [Bacillota bacterium]